MSKLIVDADAMHAVGRAVNTVGAELEDAADSRPGDPDLGAAEVAAAHLRAASTHATMIGAVAESVQRLGKYTSDAADEFAQQDAALAEAAG